MMNKQHAKLIAAMTAYDHGDAMRIQHLMKVHAFAALIGTMEQLPSHTLYILETAAIVHDIGIHVSEQKYGACDGNHQEMEGPAEARKLLEETGGYSNEVIDRVCFLVGHHHTYTQIDGQDYQILVEADFLVNGYEDHLSEQAIAHVKQKIFRTATGIRLLEEMYLHHRD